MSIFVIVTPGQDTALTIRNTLVGGRRAGISTAAGVATGQATWTFATSVGLATLLVASEPVFLALTLIGAAYLVFLGIQALWAAVRPAPSLDARGPGTGPRVRGLTAYRQGVISNLGNPKMIAFFPSLLPQFVPRGQASFSSLLLLGLIFCAMTLTWLVVYAMVVSRVGDVLRRGSLRRGLEAVMGTVLVGFGLRLAAQHR